MLGQRLWSTIDKLLIDMFPKKIWQYQNDQHREQWKELNNLVGKVVYNIERPSERQALLDEGISIVSKLKQLSQTERSNLNPHFQWLWADVTHFAILMGNITRKCARVVVTEEIRDYHGRTRLWWISIVLNMLFMSPIKPEGKLVKEVQTLFNSCVRHIRCLIDTLDLAVQKNK